ncbi:MAG: LysR family transcriptional regulator [Rhodobacteraceae bacterium]|nr:LysR family transcriptional regulator [Paracoccaceae bacterium]
MKNDSWSDIRTAYHVARLGTLSAAAAYLGMHHATAIRHIDALEHKLDCKLFHRHPRGYVPTQAGQDLLRTAGATEDQFAQMASRLRGQNDRVAGELVVTTLTGMSQAFAPILIAFQRKYPEITVSLIAQERRLKLEYGEAHVAVRAGPKPQEPDNVVQPLSRLPMALFAHKDYVKEFGMLKGRDWHKHRFVSGIKDGSRKPFDAWEDANIPPKAIVFRAAQMRTLEDAVLAGAGIGFLMRITGANNPDMIEMLPPLPEWESMLWLVTHIDLHRTAKVQAFLEFVKAEFGQCHDE